MSAIVSPSPVISGPSSTSSSASPRSRASDEPQGNSFQATLDRTRAAKDDAGKADGTAEATTTRPGTRRGAATSKDEAPTEIPNLAFFAPALPAQFTVATARAGAEASAASALRGAASATARTDARDALATTDGSAVATDADAKALPTDAATIAAQANGTSADAAHDDPLAAARKAIAAANAPAATATASAENAAAKTAAPAPDASMLGAALASAVPAAPTPAPTVRTGRSDPTTRDAVTAAAGAKVSSTDAAEADPLQGLAHIDVAAAGDADNADTGSDPSPNAWLTAAPASGTTGRAAATDSRVPVLSLAPPIDSEAWAPALGQQMLRMSATGMHTAQLNLNPEHLGPLQITLKLGEDQAQAVFSSAHEGVRKAVEAALPQLRTSLAEHGISLGQTSVGADTRQPAGQSSFAGDQPSGRSNFSAGSAYPGAGRDSTVASVDARPSAPVRSTRPEGVLDTFA